MDIKLLNNLPIEELTLKTDYLGIIEKGDLITTFLESNVQQFNEIKMFALYGEWGSGKSTLMKYLQKELDRSFNTFFFETWEFETDDNLSLSLLEYMISESKSASDEVLEDLMDVAGKLLKGFTKSVKVTFPTVPGGPSVRVDGKELVEELSMKKEKTFLELKKSFKNEFIRLEDNLKVKKGKDYNIVFIDDLDRCEPENVLNLLSAVKLFFSYGKRTIFIFGIDKKAVKEAVKTKYGEIVKANEYLEKVFDISFSMPEKQDVLKLVKHYFPESAIDSVEGLGNWDYEINKFLSEIGFTNPRRIKKVLNKYLILRVIRSTNSKGSIVGKIPNINLKEGDDSSLFETILALYFILLHEFYFEIFKNSLDVKTKKENYLNAIQATKGVPQTESRDGMTYISQAADSNIDELALSEIKKTFRTRELHLMMALGPTNLKQMHWKSLTTLNYWGKMIPENENSIDCQFFKYLLNNKQIFSSCKNISAVSLRDVKDMISKIL